MEIQQQLYMMLEIIKKNEENLSLEMAWLEQENIAEKNPINLPLIYV